jgi:hypothetical protein
MLYSPLGHKACFRIVWQQASMALGDMEHDRP